MAATIIDAFLVTLGLDVSKFHENEKLSEDDLKKLKKEAENTANAMKAEGEKAGDFYSSLLGNATKLFAIFTAGKGIKDFITDTLTAKAEMYDFASSLKVSIEETQAWGRAVKNEGGSAEGFRGSLQGMVEKLSVVGTKMRGARMAEMALNLAGLNKEAVKGKDAFTVFGMLAEKFEKMDPGRAFKLGKMLGLDTGTVRLLMKGGEEANKLIETQRKLGTYSLESAKAAKELEVAWNDAKTSLSKAMGPIVAMVAPALGYMVKLMRQLGDWTREHPALVKAAFIGIAAALGVFSIAALQAGIALLPISGTVLAIAATVALLAAGVTWLIVKWKEWIAGGKESTSMLGKFFTFILDLWNKVKEEVIGTLYGIWEYIENYVRVWIDAFELFFAAISGDEGKTKEAWKKLMDDLAYWWEGLVNFMEWKFAKFILNIRDSWKLIFRLGKDIVDPNTFMGQVSRWSNPIGWAVKAGEAEWGNIKTGINEMKIMEAQRSMRQHAVERHEREAGVSKSTQVTIQSLTINPRDGDPLALGTATGQSVFGHHLVQQAEGAH